MCQISLAIKEETTKLAFIIILTIYKPQKGKFKPVPASQMLLGTISPCRHFAKQAMVGMFQKPGKLCNFCSKVTPLVGTCLKEGPRMYPKPWEWWHWLYHFLRIKEKRKKEAIYSPKKKKQWLSKLWHVNWMEYYTASKRDILNYGM
jgi:hypothetical protein